MWTILYFVFLGMENNLGKKFLFDMCTLEERRKQDQERTVG